LRSQLIDSQEEVGSGGVGDGEGERAGVGDDDGVAAGLEALQLEMVFDDAQVPQVDVPVSGTLRLSLSLSISVSVSLSVGLYLEVRLFQSVFLCLSVCRGVSVSLSFCPSCVQGRVLSLHHLYAYHSPPSLYHAFLPHFLSLSSSA
jgi:hypothetical protein